MSRRTHTGPGNKRGELTLQILMFGAIATFIMGGFLTWMNVVIRDTYRNANRAAAFAIAEAGIEYYRWHLAHNPTDYQDGTSTTGPYVHDYQNKDGVVIGQFSLDIGAPPPGTTVVTVTSTGKLFSDQTADKVIRVQFGKQSFTKYAVLTNSDNLFGAGTEVSGPVHANGGIRFDGLAHNLVTSAVNSYNDPDHGGQDEYGVHTHATTVDPLPPDALPARADVFQAGRQFPVPAIDFTGLNQTLADIKADAQTSGFYRASSTAFGYDVVLKVDDTFDLYKVTALTPAPNGCQNYSNQDGWGTWSIDTETLIGNYAIPANGLVFLEDDVWVRGQVSTTRITVASGRFPDNPSTRSSLTVNNDLVYTYTDGKDTIGLIAQKNLNVGMVSEDSLRIDGAMMAINGRVGRYYYAPPGQQQQNRCSPYDTRSDITTYGSIVSNGRYGFAYTNDTGYQTRNLNYDTNLLDSPPPGFPYAMDQISIISWEEIK